MDFKEIISKKIYETDVKIVRALGFASLESFTKEIKTKNDLNAYCLHEFGGFPKLIYTPDGVILTIENYHDKSLTVLLNEVHS